MSYGPLPATFLDDLRRCAGRPCVEVGCGDGRFSRLLSRAGAAPLRLDRQSRRAGSVADVVADAHRLPLRAGSVALLVAAGLLRHLWPLAAGRVCPDDWRRCLAPDGAIWIFEDEPQGSPPAARNYRDAMALLARVAPERRGPLLPLGDFLRRATAAPGWACRRATVRNEVAPDDAEALARVLEGDGATPGSEGAGLAAAIRREGLAYGSFWWARLSREPA